METTVRTLAVYATLACGTMALVAFILNGRKRVGYNSDISMAAIGLFIAFLGALVSLLLPSSISGAVFVIAPTTGWLGALCIRFTLNADGDSRRWIRALKFGLRVFLTTQVGITAVIWLVAIASLILWVLSF